MAATDTAWTKVAAELKTVLVAAAASETRDIKFFTSADRTELEPLTGTEIPGVIIGVAKVDFDYSEEHGQMRHTAQLTFSVQSGAESLNIDPSNQDIIAFIVATLAASDDLSGMVEFLDPVSADASEQAAPDIGEALLIFECTLYTPTNDFRTIIARGGVHL